MFRMIPDVFILSLIIAKDVIIGTILLYMSFKDVFIKNLEPQLYSIYGKHICLIIQMTMLIISFSNSDSLHVRKKKR